MQRTVIPCRVLLCALAVLLPRIGSNAAVAGQAMAALTSRCDFMGGGGAAPEQNH